jgi:hypothetical protein
LLSRFFSCIQPFLFVLYFWFVFLSIPPTLIVFFQGTYRYQGWCPALNTIVKLNLNDPTTRDDIVGKSYAEALLILLNAPAGTHSDKVRDFVASELELSPSALVLNDLAWLGAFSSTQIVPEGANSALDAMCALFEQVSFDFIFLYQFGISNRSKCFFFLSLFLQLIPNKKHKTNHHPLPIENAIRRRRTRHDRHASSI